MEQFRFKHEEDFGHLNLWWAEERTSFGWERVHGTTGFSQLESLRLLREKKGDVQ